MRFRMRIAICLASILGAPFAHADEPGTAGIDLDTPPEHAAQSRPAASLVDVEWHAVEIEGETVTPGIGNQPLTLTFVADGNRVSGFSGCNQFGGPFEIEGDGLEFGQLVATLRACEGYMQQERRLLDALPRVRRFAIDGNVLSLYDAENRLRIRLEADASS